MVPSSLHQTVQLWSQNMMLLVGIKISTIQIQLSISFFQNSTPPIHISITS